MSGRIVTNSPGYASTTNDVLKGVDLRGKLAIVTGGSAGLGKETARSLGVAGADVFLAARSDAALSAVRQELLKAGVKNVHFAPLDLMSGESIENFSQSVASLNRPIDILIANAGIMASPLMRDGRGNEAQFSTNYLGHALLVSQLAPLLEAAPAPRFIALSSTAHHMSPVILDDLNFNNRAYNKFAAYGQSKSASSLLAVKVSTAMKARGVTSLAVHPGMIATDLSQFLTPEDLEESRKSLGEKADKLPPFKSIQSGAATTVWAATAPQLSGSGFLYLEDCGIAPKIDEPNYAYGVLPYASDPGIANSLWHQAEALLDRSLPL